MRLSPNAKRLAKLIQEKGVEMASKTIGDKEGPFVWKDTYVFLMDLDGKMIAHPIKPELTERDNLLQVADT
jgi:cytochrome c